ncbi:zf-HC2 domain-containing protein [Amycolatopsis sp. NEAU-NG30]|uniref:Zf-HC2 domain-containing protein n=1 Tax=Amycolatopsis melonis TaxID=3156488 RepID=A0ABV0LIA8_9PSEU
MTDPYGEWDAAYVLGALSPADRREYEHHLTDCPQCAAAVASFAGLPGILSAVPRETSVELLGPATLATPATLLPGLVRAARAHRRRARTRVAAALALTALAGAVAGWRLFPQPCAPAARVDRTTHAPASGTGSRPGAPEAGGGVPSPAGSARPVARF